MALPLFDGRELEKMNQMDCCLTQGSHWFRYRACAIIPDGNRILMATNPGVDYLYSVGGGVHHGETAEEAVKREVLEETGVAMEVERLAAVHENFFIGLMDDPDRLCHEVSLYFLMKPASLDAIKDTGVSGDGLPEHLVWVPFEDFGRIQVYPHFLPEIILHQSQQVRHIVTRE